MSLNNLGMIFSSIGQKNKALDYYLEALHIRRELGEYRREGITLSNLGNVYNDLGENELALSSYKKALTIIREVEDRWAEGEILRSIGKVYFEQSRYDVALACFLVTRSLFEEVQNSDRDEVQKLIDDLHKKVGEEHFAALLALVAPEAQQIVDQVLHEGVQ